MNGLLHAPWLSVVGWALVHSLWEGALVTLAAALILRGLRGASPRLRYAVAVAALLLIAGLPVRHLMPLAPEPRPVVRVGVHPGGAASTRFQSLTVAAALARTSPAKNLEGILPWLVALWAAGAGVSLLRLAGGWVWLQRLRWSRAELAPDTLQGRLLGLCRRAGLKRAVTLLRCDGLAGPSVVGFLRPAILVPAGWFLNLPADQVEALLAHELAHVLRHDYGVNLLQSLLEVVLFYHPGVWWLSRRIRAERELACDTFAAHLMGDPLPLAEALTALERRGLGPIQRELAPAAHGGSLMERIAHLLLPPRRTSSAPAFGATGILALLLVSGFHLAAQAPDPTPAVPPVIPSQDNAGGQARGKVSASNCYLRSHNALDASGKPLAYTLLLDVKADQMPLNQVWSLFENATEPRKPFTTSQTWSSRDERIGGPRVNLDLKGADPSEVLALLNRLAAQNGVEPYQAPPPSALRNFSVTKYALKDGGVCLDLHARQVSKAFLDKLLGEARQLAAEPDMTEGTCGFDRACDKGPGPKVDAIFEGLSLPELEARVRKLQAEAL